MLYLKLFRLWQWGKNLIIFIPLILSKELTLISFMKTAVLFFSFSFLVSGTYILNDIADIEQDKLHPEKKFRPLAANQININSAKLVSSFLIIGSLLFINFYFDSKIFYLSFSYLLITYIYSKRFKFINFLDSLSIATLFIIRLLLGSWLNNISITDALFSFIFTLCLLIVYLKKNSIINKSVFNKSRFFLILEKQNKKISYLVILYLLLFANLVTLIYWGYNFSDNLIEFALLFLLILVYSFFLIRLINFSEVGKVEDFILTIISKNFLFHYLLMFLLFIYIYF